MRLTETIPTSPITVEKSLRKERLRVLTSSRAGKIVPLAYFPLLREDRIASGQMRVRLEMAETAEMLMNAINVTVFAHFIPFLAAPRFKGMDDFNRSYSGVPEEEGGTPIPFFKSMTYHRDHDIFRAMGLHAPAGSDVNTSIVQAYNLLVNHRRRARSVKLPMRDLDDTSLAKAFWHHTNMAHIVPDFDQASIDGEVSLKVVAQRMEVQGLGVTSSLNSSGKALTFPNGNTAEFGDGELFNELFARRRIADEAVPAIFVELEQQGVKLSLSNIELAKKTAAFAQLRSQFAGIEDDHIIDLLMDGIRVPDEALKQPILLDRKTTIVGYSRRFATDASNLDKSVTTGETFVDLRMRTPPMNTGGIVMITCEIVPEQLFERQKDYFFCATSVQDLPNFTADYLDPEKVSVVKNDHVDVKHSEPDATFGYAPLNHQWQRDRVQVGGKYFRPDANAAFDEDRQKLWAQETVDPTLTEDFYMVSGLHHKVFADTTKDQFEYTCRGEFDIIGNTVFGKGLRENTHDYFAVAADVDRGRINKNNTGGGGGFFNPPNLEE